jgi:N-methylhydantoinase A
VPVIDLAEVSAGGGSVAWIDPGGALRVGPESTGAEPGPACYGQGGTRATVTDADLVLGYLDQEALLGGALPVSVERARQAIQEHVGRLLELDLTAAAAAIVEVVNANMAAALRVVSVERGHDPREFALVAFGGAGPVHAARLAEELDIPTVVIPPIPGGFSALGLVAGDFRRDYARTFYTPLATADVERLAMAYEAMEGPARAMLAETGLAADRWHLARSADLRYPQQAYELTVPLADGPVTSASLDRLAQDFHDRHRMTYGHASPDEPVQLVNVRLSAIGRLDRLELSAHGSLAPTAVPPPRTRQAYFRETGLAPCEVVPRDSVVAGADRSGPLIVESMDSTIVVPPTWRLRCDAAGFMILTRRAP